MFYKPNTSSHYTTNDKESTAGVNGLGAELCNFVSSVFIIVNYDVKNNTSYKTVIKFTPSKTHNNLITKDI